MYKIADGLWMQIVFCDPPKETDYQKILLEYTERLNLQKGWSVITAVKVECETNPTDKWGVALFRNDRLMAERHLESVRKFGKL